MPIRHYDVFHTGQSAVSSFTSQDKLYIDSTCHANVHIDLK